MTCGEFCIRPRRLQRVDLEADIDRLYGVPLDEFVAERDQLAKRLNKEGDREAGARIKALRKPTVGAWALNQAVRRRRKETAALLATGERLREPRTRCSRAATRPSCARRPRRSAR